MKARILQRKNFNKIIEKNTKLLLNNFCTFGSMELMKVKLARLILGYFLLQSIIIGACTYFFALSKYAFYAFFLFNVLWHFVIYFYLTSHTEAFFNTETAKKLDDINLANAVSLFRASSVMSVGFLIWNYENRTVLIVAVCYAVVIFLSDALDGLIARHAHETTELGKMIDSMSDYALLIFISALFYEKEILPLWFFILLFIRFFMQGYGMVKFISLGFPMAPVSTIGGKLTVAGTMLLYFFALLSLLVQNEFLTQSLHIGVIICAAVIFIFLFEKLFLFYRHYKVYRENKNKKK